MPISHKHYSSGRIADVTMIFMIITMIIYITFNCCTENNFFIFVITITIIMVIAIILVITIYGQFYQYVSMIRKLL